MIALNRRRYMGASKQEKVLFEMYNQYFDGTVNSVVDTGLKLWDGSHNSWKMEVVYQKLTGQANLTTLFAVRPDFSPYSGIRIRMSGNNNSLDFTISDSWNIIKNDGEFTTYISANYGNSLRKNAPLDYDTFIIIRNGNTLSIDYNGYTAEVLITNPLTNNLNLLIGCDYMGTNNQTQRYYTGTVQKFVVTELPDTYDAEIEYLESKKVASQVIDTGFIPNQNTIIEAVVKLPNFGQGVHFVYGAGTGVMANNIELYTWDDITLNFNGNKTLSSTNVPTSSFIKIVQQNGKNSIYDLQGNLIKEGVFSETTFTCSNTLVLFGLHRSNYIGLDIIKRLKVFDGITPVFDFIPVRVGQTGYLYDNISGRLLGQGDASAYNLGPDKT